MGNTILEKIFKAHTQSKVSVDDIIDIQIDIRAARDFGGANVVKHLEGHNLSIHDPSKTFFTFDCNPGGCDQKYASNQHLCRLYARKNNITVYDIDKGIGTHIAFEEGLLKPGGTFVSTDSHANILGALGAFGQGMGDIDIAHTFAYGETWFKVPPTVKIILQGKPSLLATPKDIVLKMCQQLGANGLLGYAAELYGDYIDTLSIDGRVTIASMATEMGGIIILIPPNNDVLQFYKKTMNTTVKPVYADEHADYAQNISIDIQDLEPQLSRPGHPEDVIPVKEVIGTPIDSGFIGSCTNGRFEDLNTAAHVLNNHTIAPGRILKIVPSTDRVWRQCLHHHLMTTFKEAGALIGSAGCAGCAAGQIGQTGVGEVTISTGNRNFTGKQGKGDIYLASPATVAASLIAGAITTANALPKQPTLFLTRKPEKTKQQPQKTEQHAPLKVQGRTWVIQKDNIDTDMIYHNRYLTITNMAEMGQYTFDNLKGYEQFSKQARRGDIVVVGKNFGCGSSRQQAVDCFKTLGIAVIIAESFGAIYERNAINSALPILSLPECTTFIHDKDVVDVDFLTGTIKNHTQNKTYKTKPFSSVQQAIYKRGGLLER